MTLNFDSINIIIMLSSPVSWKYQVMGQIFNPDYKDTNEVFIFVIS